MSSIFCKRSGEYKIYPTAVFFSRVIITHYALQITH